MADFNQLIRQIQPKTLPGMDFSAPQQYGSDFQVRQPRGEPFQQQQEVALQRIEDLRSDPQFGTLSPEDQDWLVDRVMEDLQAGVEGEQQFKGPVQPPGQEAMDFFTGAAKQIGMAAPLPLAGAALGAKIGSQLLKMGNMGSGLMGAAGGGLGEAANQLLGITNPSMLDIGLSAGVPAGGAVAGGLKSAFTRGRAMSHPAAKQVLGEQHFKEATGALPELPHPSSSTLYSRLQADPDYRRQWVEQQKTGRWVPGERVAGEGIPPATDEQMIVVPGGVPRPVSGLLEQEGGLPSTFRRADQVGQPERSLSPFLRDDTVQTKPQYQGGYQEGPRGGFTEMVEEVRDVQRAGVKMTNTEGATRAAVGYVDRVLPSGEIGNETLAKIKDVVRFSPEMTPEQIDFRLKSLTALEGSEGIHPTLKHQLSGIKTAIWEDVMASPLGLKEGMAEAYHAHKQELLGGELRDAIRRSSQYTAGEASLGNPGSVVKAMDDFKSKEENAHYFLPDRQTGQPVITPDEWNKLRTFMSQLGHESYQYGGGVGTLGEFGAIAGTGFALGSAAVLGLADDPGTLLTSLGGAAGVLASLMGLKIRGVDQRARITERITQGQNLRDRMMMQLRNQQPRMRPGTQAMIGVGLAQPLTNIDELEQ